MEVVGSYIDGYVYFDDVTLEELDPGWTTTRSTYGLAGQPIAIQVSTTNPSEPEGLYFIHTDHLGSVSAMSNTSGNLAGDIVRFEPFGVYRPGSGPSDITDRGFTGHRHNDSLGLVYMNARYYVGAIGRFASADTIVPQPFNPQAFNRFSYVQNNPLRFLDPTGHEPTCIVDSNEMAVPTGQDCQDAVDYIEGDFPGLFEFEGEWTYWEIMRIWAALLNIRDAVGGLDMLIALVGSDPITIKRDRRNRRDNPQMSFNHDERSITVFNEGIRRISYDPRDRVWDDSGVAGIKPVTWWLAHEIAHAIQGRPTFDGEGNLTGFLGNFVSYTEGSCNTTDPSCYAGGYQQGSAPPGGWGKEGYDSKTPGEDWAETFAYYTTLNCCQVGSNSYTQASVPPGNLRENFYRGVLRSVYRIGGR